MNLRSTAVIICIVVLSFKGSAAEGSKNPPAGCVALLTKHVTEIFPEIKGGKIFFEEISNLKRLLINHGMTEADASSVEAGLQEVVQDYQNSPGAIGDASRKLKELLNNPSLATFIASNKWTELRKMKVKKVEFGAHTVLPIRSSFIYRQSLIDYHRRYSSRAFRNFVQALEQQADKVNFPNYAVTLSFDPTAKVQTVLLHPLLNSTLMMADADLFEKWLRANAKLPRGKQDSIYKRAVVQTQWGPYVDPRFYSLFSSSRLFELMMRDYELDNKSTETLIRTQAYKFMQKGLETLSTEGYKTRNAFWKFGANYNNALEFGTQSVKTMRETIAKAAQL